MENYLQKMFIDEAQHALDRHSGGGGGTSIPETIILVDEAGNECAAVLTDEVVELTATPNDIREGKTAVTENGIEVGEKFIPSYHTTEGVQVVPNGSSVTISALKKMDAYNYTKLQVIMCAYNTSLSNSTSAIKVSINDNVYDVMSTDILSKVAIDDDNKIIDFGITNNTGSIMLLRYFTYKEVI